MLLKQSSRETWESNVVIIVKYCPYNGNLTVAHMTKVEGDTFTVIITCFYNKKNRFQITH